MQFEQREVLAIINVSEIKDFLGDDLFMQFKLNYKNAIRYVNGSLIIKTCDLLGLLINYKTGGFVTYHQEKQ